MARVRQRGSDSGGQTAGVRQRGSDIEAVADAGLGEQVARVARVGLELAAQLVQRIRAGSWSRARRRAPGRAQQLAMRDQPARVLAERSQQAPLGRGQPDLLASAVRPYGCRSRAVKSSVSRSVAARAAPPTVHAAQPRAPAPGTRPCRTVWSRSRRHRRRGPRPCRRSRAARTARRPAPSGPAAQTGAARRRRPCPAGRGRARRRPGCVVVQALRAPSGRRAADSTS